jgi:hypothetical protein
MTLIGTFCQSVPDRQVKEPEFRYEPGDYVQATGLSRPDPHGDNSATEVGYTEGTVYRVRQTTMHRGSWYANVELSSVDNGMHETLGYLHPQYFNLTERPEDWADYEPPAVNMDNVVRVNARMVGAVGEQRSPLFYMGPRDGLITLNSEMIGYIDYLSLEVGGEVEYRCFQNHLEVFANNRSLYLPPEWFGVQGEVVTYQRIREGRLGTRRRSRRTFYNPRAGQMFHYTDAGTVDRDGDRRLIAASSEVVVLPPALSDWEFYNEETNE